MPAFPQQMPVLPATPGNVASTSVTTRAFAGATVSTPRRGQPPARQQRIGATRRARPRLQPEPTRTSESEESEELTEPTTPREPGATAREFDEDTYQLPVAVTLGTGQIPPGTMITVEAVGLTNNQVKIRISDGRLVIVRRDELERALGRRLAE